MSQTATEDTTFIDDVTLTDQDVQMLLADKPVATLPELPVLLPLSVTVLDSFNQRKARGAPDEDLYLCRVTIVGQPIGDVYINLRGVGSLAAAGRDYLFANRPA